MPKLFHDDSDTSVVELYLHFKWLESFSYHVTWTKLFNILGYFHLLLCCQLSCDQNVWYHAICTYSWLTVCVNCQAEGELSSLKVGRVPVVTAGGSPVFLPLSREDQAGQLNPHLPVIILEPSGLVHTSLLTGETRTHWHIYCRLVDACTHSRPWTQQIRILKHW